MLAALLNRLWVALGLWWLAGPILDKELRVSSRRRRNYVLRFAYLALLTVFLILVWIEETQSSGGTVLYRVSRMGRAGQTIVAFIIWFQFCATQGFAAIALSTSISDEICHRTLGTLMTTPVSSLQIVMGKLLSKLLQAILLLAVSLPLLAIVRVFGGVPWDYVLSSVCMTLTTVIFVALLSMFFSIFNRRAYAVVIMTAVALGILFGAVPGLTTMTYEAVTGHWPNPFLTAVIFSPNPYVLMFTNMISMIEPRAAATMPLVMWPVHCAIMLGASATLMILCVSIVRKVALRQAVGQPVILFGGKGRRKTGSSAPAVRYAKQASPRRVVGPAVLWKELRSPFLGRRKVLRCIAVFAALAMLLVSYGLFANEGMLDERETHILYAIIFTTLGILIAVILPATTIASEKEAQSWPLLLTTTLGDWQIVLGKFLGVMRQCLAGWFLLLAHIAVFVVVGLMHPLALLQVAMLVVWVTIFLGGGGIYFSARFKHVTTALVANFAMAGVVWALLPLFMALLAAISHTGYDWVETYMDTNPFVHVICTMSAAAGTGQLRLYYWVGLGNLNAGETMLWMLFCMLIYMSAGVLFLWRAKCRLRRNIF
jgi:ABC-type transport system involved in multi-copper enzyme maturation permease subunit